MWRVKATFFGLQSPSLVLKPMFFVLWGLKGVHLVWWGLKRVGNRLAALRGTLKSRGRTGLTWFYGSMGLEYTDD